MMDLDRILDPRILFPIGVVISFIPGIYFARRNKGETDLIKKIVCHLKGMSMSVGIICMALWFSLPATPVLRSFGYPQDISAVDSSKELLYYLQEYNRAIVKTTEVVMWFIFVFTFFVLVTFFQIAKTLDEKQGQPKADS